MNNDAIKSTSILRFNDAEQRSDEDLLAVEEPLEIRLITEDQVQPAVVTMRTPGHDLELTAGFLFAEGLVSTPDDLAVLEACADPKLSPEKRANRVDVGLRDPSERALEVLQRSFVVSSACGVCGKASLDALELCTTGPLPLDWQVSSETIVSLQEHLRREQNIFDQTGGLHAAALFDLKGTLVRVREDVGRHNAVDKVMGSAFLAKEMPLARHILLVSGRSSFEILQKAYVASVPLVCSVSAPSSLAVDLAKRFNITLVGFLRDKRFNVYSVPERISG
jgi:FdhD protein